MLETLNFISHYPINSFMLLSEIIQQKILDHGPISFCDFMEMALYYPDLGYYTSPGNKIGTDGDYYTSSALGPLFGTMIGRQLEQMWHLLDKKPLTMIEFGAGTGLLCRDILAYLKNNEKLYQDLQYCIIEKSPAMREKQKMHLHEKVSWHDSIREIAGVTGCILSNELLDNFPVHQVVMEEELMEVYVDYQDGFVEILRPAGKMLQDYLAELNVHLPKGYRTETNLKATEWITEIAASLERGFIITIDYGYSSSEYYNESRTSGTLLCYHRHQINGNPYENIGAQDITAHVNFSALCHWGLLNGCECCGLTKQANFLLALGFEDHWINQKAQGQDLMDLVKKQAFLKHTLLVGMGSKFKVLIQQKGIGKQELLGLRYA
jgi:SAM-dependent MidA family methyltransferase